MDFNRIFIAGIPRSGTTWLSKVLSQAEGYKYIHEPDNERHTYTGFYYKRGLPRFPYISDVDNNDRYFKLFYEAFFGSHINMESHYNSLLFKLGSINKTKIENWLFEDKINPNRICPEYLFYPLLPKDVTSKDEKRIVKSVHAALSLSYIYENHKIPTLVILRHPASVISSYIRMGNKDIDRNLYSNKKLLEDRFKSKKSEFEKIKSSSLIVKAGLQIGILYDSIHETLNKHPSIKLVLHEDICTSPTESFKEIFNDFHLKWDSKVANYIRDNDTKGSGYDTRRIASENIDIWKKVLNENQINEIKQGYSIIEPKFYKEFI